jgi:isopentenyl phosphate kinase
MKLKSNELTVIKLGGSVITKKLDGKAEINEENLFRLTKEIAGALDKKSMQLIIVHGAGPFGHMYAKKYKLHLGMSNGLQIKGIGITHRMMEWLNHEVVKALQEEGVSAMPFQPSAGSVLCNRKLVQFPLNIAKRFTDMGLVIVSHGDVLLDNKTGIGILSGDHLAPYLAQNLNADRIIFGADVDGVFTKDPRLHDDAELVKLITPNNITEVVQELGGSQGTDVTGGMAKKVSELLELAKEGTTSEIINATKPEYMKRALLGETNLGTIITGG